MKNNKRWIPFLIGCVLGCFLVAGMMSKKKGTRLFKVRPEVVTQDFQN
jgi:hypothetical protein